MLGKMKHAWLCATMLFAATPLYAARPTLQAATPLVNGAIDDSVLSTLSGDHAATLPRAEDRGALDDNLVLAHVMIGLKRPPALQAALNKLTSQQYSTGSPNFHQWITAADLRAFGPAQADIDAVTTWLKSHGLTVNRVSPSGMSIDAAGRAADFASAFHTPLHNVALNGEAHIANISDPSIPAALAPVVQGITLSNFFPKPNLVRTKPLFTIPAHGKYPAFYAVAPADFATIYNLNPLLSGSYFGIPITGAGITIAVVEQTNIRSNDWNRFRSVFGLSGYSGTLSLQQPGGCANPGFTGDEGEAALDSEWSSASAPDANIIEAACAGSNLTFGVMTTLQNIVEMNTTKATILSISYGGSEQGNGLTFLQMWANLVQEGAAQGYSIVISSGDSGVSADEGSIDVDGLAVNGLASNEYDTSIGGTDFYDTALNQTKQYWKQGNTKQGQSSARSYVPEIPWNNSCASSIIATYYSIPSGLAYCNSTALGGLQNGIGGSGGASIYYAKPDWQLLSVLGVPNDGVRDQPDVSLFAANGIWNHFYLFCMSDAKEGGAPCKYHGTTKGVPNALSQAAGGTSFAAPAFAGLLALISNANNGQRLGNPAPRLYQIAQLQYSNPLTTTPCSATLGNQIGAGCIFYDVTAGDNNEPCYKGTPDCYVNKLSTLGIGILSASKDGAPAYLAQPGYSLATGLGTVNATNLVVNY